MVCLQITTTRFWSAYCCLFRLIRVVSHNQTHWQIKKVAKLYKWMQFDAFSLNLNSCRVCYNEILKGLTIILLWCLIIVWIVPKFELLLKSANLCLKYPTSLPKLVLRLTTTWLDQANWFELLSYHFCILYRPSIIRMIPPLRHPHPIIII